MNELIDTNVYECWIAVGRALLRDGSGRGGVHVTIKA